MVGVALEKIEDDITSKKRQKKYDRQREIENKQILEKIAEIQNSIKTINSVFDFVTDYELIDGCIYELNALYKKHSYYIKVCKERDIQCIRLH